MQSTFVEGHFWFTHIFFTFSAVFTQSEVSQEDHKERNLELVPSNSTIREPQNLGDAQTSVATSSNGRVSPGGTIYKGMVICSVTMRFYKHAS